jgi:hypothetical protein
MDGLQMFPGSKFGYNSAKLRMDSVLAAQNTGKYLVVVEYGCGGIIAGAFDAECKHEEILFRLYGTEIVLIVFEEPLRNVLAILPEVVSGSVCRFRHFLDRMFLQRRTNEKLSVYRRSD